MFTKTAETETVEVVDPTLTKKAKKLRGFTDLDEKERESAKSDEAGRG